MKKISIAKMFTLGLLFLAATSISAQGGSKLNGALLWKVSGKNLAQPSYILGTHHLTPVNFVDSIAGLKDAIAETQQTVGEMLLSDKAFMQTKMQQAALMPTGESYNNLLSADDYTKLDNGLRNLFSVGLEQFGALKPGMISMLHTITIYAKTVKGFNPMGHEAIDEYVQRIATENGKSVIGLEKIEDQIHAIFDAEPIKDQAEALACNVNNGDFIKESILKLNTYYRLGQLDEMYNLAFHDPSNPCLPSLAYKNTLAKDRNEKWLLQIPALMADKSSLIAVGALHLAGEEGLLNQLAKMAYTIEAVQ